MPNRANISTYSPTTFGDANRIPTPWTCFYGYSLKNETGCFWAFQTRTNKCYNEITLIKTLFKKRLYTHMKNMIPFYRGLWIKTHTHTIMFISVCPLPTQFSLFLFLRPKWSQNFCGTDIRTQRLIINYGSSSLA